MRVTPQHIEVWRLLVGSGGHFTPEKIREKTRDELPGVELSTVSRTPDALREAGLVVEKTGCRRGRKVFEAGVSFHPHPVREGCGEVYHPGLGAAGRLSGLDLGDFRTRGVYR